MNIWDYDWKTIRKTPRGVRWQLERMINFGTGGKKIEKNGPSERVSLSSS